MSGLRAGRYVTARPLFKVDRNVDWQARCLKAEARLAETLRENDALETELAAAHRNVHRFHALLIAERIRKTPGKGER